MGTVVFMHENAGNIGLRIPFFEIIVNDLQMNVLSMAYRGYSYSDQVSPTEEGIKKDADAIIKFLRNPEMMDEEIADYINPKLIFLQGRSLGGAVAAYMAQQAPDVFRGLILENTFTSIWDMVDHVYFFIKPFKKYMLKIKWDTDKIIPELHMPIFLITGSKDELVPSWQTQKLYDLAIHAPIKDQYIIENGTHNDSWFVGG